jgi:magnesium-transporting ATPase (P-type)
VTINLQKGLSLLAARNVFMRRLTSVETLGACNVICSDKTGTLTEGKMVATRMMVICGQSTGRYEFFPTRGFDPNGGIYEQQQLDVATRRELTDAIDPKIMF